MRPWLFLLALLILLSAIDGTQLRVLSPGTLASVLENYASLGPVALALGLSMILREFDLSVGAMLSLGGCIAVITGSTSPLLGFAAAAAAGICIGLIQAFLMLRLNLSSVGVTLGGLLTLTGLSYVLTGGEALSYSRMDIANLVAEKLFGVVSLRALFAIGVTLLAALLLGTTRIGRDVLATGSDRRAARTAGVATTSVILGVFAASGLLTGTAGALLSYSLAAASPAGLSDVLIPATAAAIIGGVSLAGGRGTPLGIAAGALTIGLLDAGLSAIEAPPWLQQVATGLVLLLVALSDAEDLKARLTLLRRPNLEGNKP